MLSFGESSQSYYAQCIDLLEIYTSHPYVLTKEQLKSAYRAAVLKHHPDRGGSVNDVDKIKNAFKYLASILDPGNSGRGCGSETIDDPDILKNKRGEINVDSVMSALIDAQISDEKAKHEKFNREFEEKHKHADYEEKGYSAWLAHDRVDGADYSTPEILKNVNLTSDNFNQVFEKSIKRGSNVVPGLASLSELAISTYKSNTDYNLIHLNNNAPKNALLEYSDVYSAFTDDNTITDKVSFDDPRINDNNNFDKRMKNYMHTRDSYYSVPLSDNERKAASYTASWSSNTNNIITNGGGDDKKTQSSIFSIFKRSDEKPEDAFVKSINARGIDESQQPTQIPKNHCGVPSSYQGTPTNVTNVVNQLNNITISDNTSTTNKNIKTKINDAFDDLLSFFEK